MRQCTSTPILHDPHHSPRKWLCVPSVTTSMQVTGGTYTHCGSVVQQGLSIPKALWVPTCSYGNAGWWLVTLTGHGYTMGTKCKAWAGAHLAQWPQRKQFCELAVAVFANVVSNRKKMILCSYHMKWNEKIGWAVERQWTQTVSLLFRRRGHIS